MDGVRVVQGKGPDEGGIDPQQVLDEIAGHLAAVDGSRTPVL